jgi:hypothetical protein
VTISTFSIVTVARLNFRVKRRSHHSINVRSCDKVESCNEVEIDNRPMSRFKIYNEI